MSMASSLNSGTHHLFVFGMYETMVFLQDSTFFGSLKPSGRRANRPASTGFFRVLQEGDLTHHIGGGLRKKAM